MKTPQSLLLSRGLTTKTFGANVATAEAADQQADGQNTWAQLRKWGEGIPGEPDFRFTALEWIGRDFLVPKENGQGAVVFLENRLTTLWKPGHQKLMFILPSCPNFCWMHCCGGEISGA